ncbi:hypothetical protein [Acrocarpospora catenulata]|uniref:hypothetical protein n=1 Tax=Acrocarpospora catenulata TaxID=2836182 RepID=UPI001BDA978B|nr:hypothetical protein [Acrocarpospora catenulata]
MVRQIAAAWLVGSLLSPLLLWVVVVILFGGSPALLALLAVPMVGALCLVAWTVRQGSPLTSRGPGGRVSWAALVFLVGAVGFVGGAWANAELELPFGREPLMFLASGLPFALAAGMLSQRRVALGAVAVTTALVVTTVYLVVQHRVDKQAAAVAADLAARLQPVRDLLYVVQIPGYRVSGRDTSGVSAFFEPLDQRVVKVWQDHTIVLTAERGWSEEMCAGAFLAAPLGRDEHPRCVLERPGLWYLTGRIPEPEWGCPCGLQQYIRQDGGVMVRVHSSDAVPREVLRDAVLNARHATEEEARELLTPS